MQHTMKLHHEPFELIKNGFKTIEMRLFDEKRQLLNLGDEITFTDTSNEHQITCEVLSLNEYKDFTELYKNYDKKDLGYSNDEIANPKDMLRYYSEEDIKDYGVIAIKIKEVGTF